MEDWGSRIKETSVPALVIPEGLTMYLTEPEIQRFSRSSPSGSRRPGYWRRP